jgi:hypothetical protein
MNLFRSEEHARNHSGFDPAMAERMLRPVSWWANVFANPFFRERGRPDYMTWIQSDDGQAAFAELRSNLAPS